MKKNNVQKLYELISLSKGRGNELIFLQLTHVQCDQKKIAKCL